MAMKRRPNSNAEMILQTPSLGGLKWDVHSFLFREAVRRGDTSAKQAMEAEVEFGLRRIGEEFGCDADIVSDEGERRIIEIISDYLTDAEFTEEDRAENDDSESGNVSEMTT
jgi:hypothetical protein